MTGALAGPAVDLTRAGRERVHQVLPRIRSVLDALIRIPSVSAESERAPAMRASADAVAAAFAGIGLDARVVVVDGGQPAVIASTVPQVAARPRVLLYAHHDVQPAGPGWSVAPFEPLERDGRLYGRGSADDKGGIAVHLAALLAAGDDLAYDVTVLVEGEEEIGSPTLAATLARYGEDLRADLVLVPDAVNEAGGVPTVTTRLRGLAQVLVRVSTADGPVHSGLYGGAAPDALTTLARLLATLHDEDGRVAVTGLLTEPDAPSPLAGDFRAGARLLPDTVSIGHGSLADRLVGGPAISVIAIEAPTLAESANVLVPTAAARISLRTVAGQPARHAQAALAEHLTAHAPWGATVEITLETTGDGVDLSAEKPLQRLSFDALSSAFGQPVRLVGAGGSIPFVGALAAALPDASIVVTAVQDPSTRAHAEDESLDLAALENAALAEFLILTDGTRSARPLRPTDARWPRLTITARGGPATGRSPRSATSWRNREDGDPGALPEIRQRAWLLHNAQRLRCGNIRVFSSITEQRETGVIVFEVATSPVMNPVEPGGS